jgi:hypothetical protein
MVHEGVKIELSLLSGDDVMYAGGVLALVKGQTFTRSGITRPVGELKVLAVLIRA